MDKQTIVDSIAAFPALSEVPRAQIEWVIERGEYREYKAGESYFKPGDPIDKLIFVLEGIITFKMEQNGQFKELGRLTEGAITGALPYSRAQTASAIGSAVVETKLFVLDKGYFRELVCDCHELTTVFVHEMTDRVRSFTRTQQQNEKLMALGKLSAGLAHELNNPAAAIVRSSESLQSHLGTVPEKFKRVINMKVTEAEVDFVNDLLFGKLEAGIDKGESLMQRTEREDELTDWLDDNGYGDCYALSETLAEYGFCADDLQDLVDNTSEESFPSIIEWMDNVLTTEKMVGEIKEASNRISKLVSSVKSYSHMDKAAEMEATDVHVGIHNTLTMLNHKIKKNKVKIEENLTDDLSKIEAIPGELNQVWTNIMDNALDAMEKEGGTMSIETVQNESNVMVSIIDSGPGIPEDIQSRIFEPFFTTKDVGKGTGLGLETVQKIVEKHKGYIKLESKPGKTKFEFCFPKKG